MAKGSGGGVRERILETACGLFYRRGVHAVGVDEIVAHSGAAKMSLYKHFGSKDELVRAYVDLWEERWLARLREWVESRSDEPQGRLLAVFDFLREEVKDPDFRGCARLNAAIELSDPQHPVRAVCREKKEGVRHYMRDLAEQAGLRDPEGLSRALSVLLNGAITTTLVEIDGPAPAETARRAAATLIATHRA